MHEVSFNKDRRDNIKKYILEKIDEGSADYVSKTEEAFGISANTVYRYLRELQEAGAIEKCGRKYLPAAEKYLSDRDTPGDQSQRDTSDREKDDLAISHQQHCHQQDHCGEYHKDHGADRVGYPVFFHPQRVSKQPVGFLDTHFCFGDPLRAHQLRQTYFQRVGQRFDAADVRQSDAPLPSRDGFMCDVQFFCQLPLG